MFLMSHLIIEITFIEIITNGALLILLKVDVGGTHGIYNWA